MRAAIKNYEFYFKNAKSNIKKLKTNPLLLQTTQ